MTYEYICTACQNAWEAEQSISEAALKVCPRCGAETAKRQVSGGAGFILKGGGWYADLYGSTPKKPASGDTSSTTPEAKPADTKKADSGSSDSSGTTKADTGTGAGGSDGGSKGTSSGSGSKGGAASSAA